MHYARLDDGRRVIVNTATQPTRKVTIHTNKCYGVQQFFVDTQKYTEVLLDGGWQVVHNSRLKNEGFGSPFERLR